MDVAHRRRTRCLEAARREEVDQAPLRTTAIDPRCERYWELMDAFGDMHGHVLKYACSFLDLKGSAASSEDLQAFGRIVWPQLAAAALEWKPGQTPDRIRVGAPRNSGRLSAGLSPLRSTICSLGTGR